MIIGERIWKICIFFLSFLSWQMNEVTVVWSVALAMNRGRHGVTFLLPVAVTFNLISPAYGETGTKPAMVIIPNNNNNDYYGYINPLNYTAVFPQSRTLCLRNKERRVEPDESPFIILGVWHD